MTSSKTEIVCEKPTKSATLPSQAQPIVDCECDALKKRIRFLISEMDRARRDFAQARGQLQRVEAMLAELSLTIK